MTHVLNTLYITTPKAYLQKEGETVVIRIDDAIARRVPIHTLGSIICFGSVGYTDSVYTGVAPHAGAWIETRHRLPSRAMQHVAPHAGAWIETYRLRFLRLHIASRPTRARGLKQSDRRSDGCSTGVAPHAGAWIETLISCFCADSVRRRAPRGRVD